MMHLVRRRSRMAFLVRGTLKQRAFLSSQPPQPTADELEAERKESEIEADKMRALRDLYVTPDHILAIPDVGDEPDPEDPTEITTVSGMPLQHKNRLVIIQQKGQSAMQQGDEKTKIWTLTWEHEAYWTNPLMGWNSTADPLASLEMKFETSEQAVRFAEKNGWRYYLKDPLPPALTWDEMGENKYSHNFLSVTAEYELKTLGTKTKRWKFKSPHSSHYFRPLTYHGDKECPQHGPKPDEPWK